MLHVVAMRHSAWRTSDGIGDSRVFQTFALLAVVAFFCFVIWFKVHAPRGPNTCPFDGNPAEWTHGRKDNLCDYGHFAGAKEGAHTWTASCVDENQ
jgi:hypothetical protein